MNVLVLNSGRSSLKFQVIATDVERMKQDRDDRLCRGEVEGIGGEAILTFQCQVQPQDYYRVAARSFIDTGLSGLLYRI